MSIERNAIVLGPTAAGKTQLILAARHAAGKGGFKAPLGYPVVELDTHIDDIDGGLEAYYDIFVETRGRGGLTVATSSGKDINFSISLVDGASDERLVADYHLTDVSGYLVNPGRGQQSRRGGSYRVRNAGELASELQFAIGDSLAADKVSRLMTETANSIIYCVPFNESQQEYNLHSIIPLVASTGKIERIVICMTKFDAAFEGEPILMDRGDGSFATHYSVASNLKDSFDKVRRRFAESDLRNLADSLDGLLSDPPEGGPPEITVMPVSAFGFVPDTGQANIRFKDGEFEMLTACPAEGEPVSEDYPYHPDEVLDSEEARTLWRPFQAMEALYSVLFSNEALVGAGICSFDWSDVRPAR